MYIVTGVSRGLGKAIVEELLAKNEKVIGVGRSHSFENENFSFIPCNLSNPIEIDAIEWPTLYEKVVLINNAGVLGEINRLSDQVLNDLEQVLNVNVVAPVKLLQSVYSHIKDKSNFTLVNISSGAANRAIPSWASYCASKAALNMMTEAFYLEELEKDNHPIVYTVSPGVIDTDMQLQIRNASQSQFSSVDNFIELKNSGSLYSGKLAASKLLKLVNSPFTGEVFQDLRTIELD